MRRGKTGSGVIVSARGSYLFFYGNPIRVLSAIHDIEKGERQQGCPGIERGQAEKKMKSFIDD